MRCENEEFAFCHQGEGSGMDIAKIYTYFDAYDLREIDIICRLNHRNVIKPKSCLSEGQKFYLVLPYISDISGEKKSCLGALQYLHENGYYRISPNVVADGENSLICDFLGVSMSPSYIDQDYATFGGKRESSRRESPRKKGSILRFNTTSFEGEIKTSGFRDILKILINKMMAELPSSDVSVLFLVIEILFKIALKRVVGESIIYPIIYISSTIYGDEFPRPPNNTSGNVNENESISNIIEELEGRILENILYRASPDLGRSFDIVMSKDSNDYVREVSKILRSNNGIPEIIKEKMKISEFCSE